MKIVIIGGDRFGRVEGRREPQAKSGMRRLPPRAIVADAALAAPRSGIIEIAGPERAPFNEIVTTI